MYVSKSALDLQSASVMVEPLNETKSTTDNRKNRWTGSVCECAFQSSPGIVNRQETN